MSQNTVITGTMLNKLKNISLELFTANISKYVPTPMTTIFLSNILTLHLVQDV